jgi:hypothetical protein
MILRPNEPIFIGVIFTHQLLDHEKKVNQIIALAHRSPRSIGLSISTDIRENTPYSPRNGQN